jgi:hypothetical protein
VLLVWFYADNESRRVWLSHPSQALKVLNKSFLKRKREYKRVDGKLVLSNAFQVRSLGLLSIAARLC